MSYAKLVSSVKAHEGFRTTAYQDTEGVWTIGYGTNLQTLTIDQQTAEKFLIEALDEAYEDAADLPEWEYLDTPARRNVVVEMIYNLGFAGYKKFTRARMFMENQDWQSASLEMLDSKWARQVGNRAKRLAGLMRKGNYDY